MATIAQILLPPPLRPQQIQVIPRGRNDFPVGGDESSGDDARARRFRFRVYDGGNATATDPDPRRANRAAQSSAASTALNNATDLAAQGKTPDHARSATHYLAGTKAGPGASSTFLAQAIAQEQLGGGLHNPPNDAAAAAYGRANAALAAYPSAGLDITA
jgi:hypothetical protein